MPSPIPTTEGTSYTWSDYLSWPEDERWEIIGGIAYAMGPGPSIRHQDVVLSLAARLRLSLAGKPCHPFIAPTDVMLSELDVVQPDILVVCDPAKVTPSHIQGAPDLIVEVLSPATSAKDLRQKKALYERSGVREYLVLESIENLEVPLWEIFELPSPETRSGPEDTSV